MGHWCCDILCFLTNVGFRHGMFTTCALVGTFPTHGTDAAARRSARGLRLCNSAREKEKNIHNYYNLGELSITSSLLLQTDDRS